MVVKCYPIGLVRCEMAIDLQTYFQHWEAISLEEEFNVFFNVFKQFLLLLFVQNRSRNTN